VVVAVNAVAGQAAAADQLPRIDAEAPRSVGFADTFDYVVVATVPAATAPTARLSADDLDATFAALADRTRRAMIAKLARGEASVLELAEPHDMSQPAISKHLKVLERAGLISRGKDAQRRPCRLEAKPLAEANEWLESYRKYWEGSFERLDTLLSQMKADQKKPARVRRVRRTRRVRRAKKR